MFVCIESLNALNISHEFNNRFYKSIKAVALLSKLNSIPPQDLFHFHLFIDEKNICTVKSRH